MKRIGLFGGTFNPLHLGHLRSAVEVRTQFRLDRIYFVPSSLPPHKDLKGVAEAADRLAMIRLAIGNDPRFSVSDIEFRRRGLSYTIDTMMHFKSAMPTDASIFFILGADAFQEIETWKSYRKLFDLMPFIVLSRPAWKESQSVLDRRGIREHLHRFVADGYEYSHQCTGFIHSRKKTVFLCKVTLMDIASSKIRHLVATGHSIQYLVPEKIQTYIKKRGLYL